MKFYRAYNDKLEGQWVVDFNPTGANAAELKELFAMKKQPANVAEVLLPPGSRIRMSIAGANEFGKSGILQYEILDIAPEGYNFAGIIFKKIGGLK